MDWVIVLLGIVVMLVLFLLTGLPVAFAFLIVNFIGVYFFMGEGGLSQIILSMFNSLTKFTFTPVPLFVIMGAVIFHSGMASRIIDVLDQWLGKLPGRLSLLAILSGTIFANLSGSTMAMTATLGTVIMPEMTRRGYKKPMTLGPIMGAGGLAMIIPPSILAVILGSLANISVGKLLIAGIFPGFLMAALFATYIIVRAYLQPHLAPVYDVPSIPFRHKAKSFAAYVLPLALLVFLVLGTIFIGVATPSEASALGAMGAVILAVVYKKLNWVVIKKSITTCIGITGMAYMIIAGSIAFSQLLAFTGSTRGLLELVIGLDLTPILVLVAMQIVLLFLGTFMEQVSMMMITLPIFIPTVYAAGINPIWFGLIMLINLEVGGLTPPFGMLLFVMKGVSPPDVSMGDIYRAAIPFVILDLVAMTFVILFPPIALWLPGRMG